MKVSLKQKLFTYTIALLLCTFIAAYLVLGSLKNVKEEFQTYRQIAVHGKISTLEISKDVNYISRCARDIMLGNEYEQNLEKIKNRMDSIRLHFEKLEYSIKALSNNNQILQLVDKTKMMTNAFTNEVLAKMHNIKDYKTLQEAYAAYKKDATPLAIKSRDYYLQLKETQESSFIQLTSKFEKEIKHQRDLVIAVSILFAFIIVICINTMYRSFVKNIRTQRNLDSTKQLLMQYKNAIDKTNIVSKTNTKGIITYVNDEFCKVSQYTKAELINKPHNIIRSKNVSSAVFKELWNTIKSKGIWQGIIENEKKDGTSYFVDTTVLPILDANMEVEEYIAIRKDITELVLLNKELAQSQAEILTRIGMIAESSSQETSNHVKRVAEYCQVLARNYGMSQEECELIGNASALHDIGKVSTPDHILNKPDKLTPDEFEVMKQHTSNGFHMLKYSDNEIINAASVIAHEHHERWDGNGYPRQISGTEIHIYARITAIADVFDALGTSRPYKNEWPLNEIVDYINEQSGKMFDPELVKIFNDNFNDILFIRKKFRNDNFCEI